MAEDIFFVEREYEQTSMLSGTIDAADDVQVQGVFLAVGSTCGALRTVGAELKEGRVKLA